ncbi:MAG: hypothetical protein C5B50_08655 [Verrucomicrobia bacterium]|nr:MAG: hypothetical protein C5B50_08655 [Verrucomicrobiota bacterium]
MSSSRQIQSRVSWFYPLIVFLSTATHGFCATVGTFANPLIADGADPWVICKDGTNYYYTQTTGGQVTIRSSSTISGLAFASPVTVFTPPAPNNRDVWAPELHFLNGNWYIYFAADDGNNANHRIYAAEADTADPQGTYTFKGKVADSSNDYWAIDPTVLQKDDGSLYLIWSGWPGTSNVRQNIYIAPMSNPWTISGPRVLLSTPTLNWEIYPDTSLPLINEGPEALKRDGKIFIVYSANKAWENYYCLGLLMNTNGDVLNTDAWVKYPAPVLSGFADESGAVYGPGHCSFTHNTAQTEDWIVYHAAKYSGAGFNRSVRAQPFTWNLNATPFFGQPIPTNLPVIFPAGEGPPTPFSVNPNITNGFIRLEYFCAITGTSLADVTNNVKFPGHADITRFAAQCESPSGIGSNYGSRLSGYLMPTVTGSYVFYFCSSDQGALFLSTNSDPVGNRLIAFEPQWNPRRNWTGTDRRPNQENISAPISLTAGQSYWMEALMKTESGGDNLGVAWQPPGGSVPTNGAPPIPGACLAIPFDSTLTVSPVIAQQPTNQVRYQGTAGSFSTLPVSSEAPWLQWQKEIASNNWENITGGYSNSFVLPNVSMSDAGGYRLVVKNNAGLTVSGSASLEVLNLPFLIGKFTAGKGAFQIGFEGVTNFTYTLLGTTNFHDWAMLSSTNGVNGPATFSDTNAAVIPNRAYRLSIGQ